MTHILPLGTSEPQEFKLLDDGVAIDGTAFDVGIAVTSVATCTAVSGLTVAWLVEADGTVEVTGMDVLTVGDYDVRFTLTDGDDQIGYVPNGARPDRWRVVR